MLAGLLTGLMRSAAAAGSDVVVARQLIRPQALVRRTRMSQTNPRPHATVSIKEEHALTLKSSLESCHRDLRCARFSIGLGPGDSFDCQTRALGEFSLR
jgi:hypothetical protein